MKPGNAGGGKGPQVRSDVEREKGLGSGSAYYPNNDRKTWKHHMLK